MNSKIALNNPDAKELWSIDKNHHLHSYTFPDSFNSEGCKYVLTKSEGVYLEDSEGNRYLDAVGGMWCTNIGLGRKEMATAVAEQIEKLTYATSFIDVTYEPVAKLAAKLAKIAPSNINHVFFTTCGSTAIDSAYRMILFYQNARGKRQKKHIISLNESYHGTTYLAMSIGGKKSDHGPDFDHITDTIHHISCPNYYRAPVGMGEAEYLDFLVDELENKILEVGSDKVAAFFAEPIMGSGGVVVPPAGYHRRTWEICKKYDVLYVADEVVTSFGRVGHWFSSEDLFSIQPDIITTAKGITSGYIPLGAMMYSDDIHKVISEEGHGRCFSVGYTYSGHPVACAAALKNIEIIENENLFDNVNNVGTYFEQRMKSELADLPLVGDVRGIKLMMCVEFVANKETREEFADEVGIGSLVSKQASARGLFVRPIGHLNVMSPSLILTREQADTIIDTLRDSIVATYEQLLEDGIVKS
ncbi:MAG: aminotransferase [Gammaproteobacteria bacterium]|nr:aminotransferase [Gammaproteobacteria bacterium]